MTPPNTATWSGIAVLFGTLVAAVPAHAQFGSGIVYDPTQSAHAIKQIINETQMAGTALKTYNQTVTTYNTIYNNLIHFNSKQIWHTLENALLATSVENTYGETSGLQAQLNGQSQNPSLVWRIMNLALNGTSSSFWAQQAVGASERLSTLAHIEAMDAASTACLGAVGSYNAGRTANLSANNALGTSQFDATTFTNSELEQLNLINVANAQRMQEEHAQGQIHACMAAQAAVANMDKRNAESAALNDAQYVQSQQSSNPTYAGNESGTWTSYY
ncbi:hypothetical protein ACPOL_6768 (plasmid) [Acidisarcina polymorpha]|uniref:Uncharacterized protein n=1 Tax=Acidisarcina polymorpha TaxID=2211140 RepID=A0A2Z5GAF1_9BACT|nr:hypothetical protein [Acidisarcina polymorpha]AXC15978.1 hypothetical protein ACPOL_6768 [Acidisarcina polymorpha]